MKTHRWIGLLLATVGWGIAGGRVIAATSPAIAWNEVALDAIRYAATPPPVATRCLAITHLAMFDAVNGLAPRFVSFMNHTNPPVNASAEAALAAAANQALRNLWPQFSVSFDEALQAQLRLIPADAARVAGIAWGRRVANELLLARAFDGANYGIAYEPVAAPGRWQPTPPLFASALLPQWPGVRPFVLERGDQFRPPPPPALDSPAWARDCEQVRQLGANDSSLRTADQTEIAWFWADNAGSETPPGHWNQVAQHLVQVREPELLEAARWFALLNLALADAGIAAWDAKFAYEFWRPVTAIRAADLDGNPETTPDRSWAPLIPTPPFPEYVSGHSTFSGAAAALLTALNGGDAFPFTLNTAGLFGLSRHFDRFSQAAEEAGLSRIYGGIHYLVSNTEGQIAGRRVGAYVAANALLPLAEACIRIGRAGDGIVLSWPGVFRLESSPALLPAAWHAVDGRPPLALTSADAQRFYRLTLRGPD